jgi:hypothetical protein
VRIAACPTRLVSLRSPIHPPHEGEGDRMSASYEAANFISLMASKFCTPPPTRLVV